jgi:hypothetical protein
MQEFWYWCLETETVFFAKLCVRLGDLCGFAWSSSLTAKYAKERKANCTSSIFVCEQLIRMSGA